VQGLVVVEHSVRAHAITLQFGQLQVRAYSMLS